MGELKFTVTPVDYAALAAAGDFAILQRPAGTGYPALQAGSGARASGSPALDRDAAAAAVAEQNPTLAAPDPDAVYVIGGQQAGLLTGPLYTFLKAVSAINLARHLARQLTRPVLPLFWVAAEDHDILEVNRVKIAARSFVQEYPGPLGRGQVPQVGEIPLSAAKEPLLAFLRETLQPTEFTPWILDLVAAADFSNYTTAFRDLMQALFAGEELRLLDPLRIRHLTGPILAALVERWPQVVQALAAGSEILAAAGFQPPLTDVRVFEIVDGRRVPLELNADGGRLAAGEQTLEEIAADIRRRPADFSPGAALRPICQDGALPVIATLGGPSELLYLWQILPLYDLVGVRPSARHPRISATFIGHQTARAATKADLPGERIFSAAAQLGSADHEPVADPAARAIDQRSRELLAEIDRLLLDPAPRWLRRGRESIVSGVERITAGLQEVHREAAGRGRHRLEKIAAAVLPDGKPQERVLNPFQLLNLYGRAFVDQALAELDPLATHHQLVTIAPQTKE